MGENERFGRIEFAIGCDVTGEFKNEVAKREAMDEQIQLAGMEQQLELPFPSMQMRGKRYKVFGIVTNMD